MNVNAKQSNKNKPLPPSSKSLKETLKGITPRAQSNEPLWKGPHVDGVTQSMLSSWLSCPERFRVKYILGLSPVERFSHYLEYGSMFHKCIEADDKGLQWRWELEKYCAELFRRFPISQEDIRHWQKVCLIQYPIYRDYWAQPDLERGRKKIGHEVLINTELILPPVYGVKLPVILKGKVDSVDEFDSTVGRKVVPKVFYTDTKTKGDIDQVAIQQQMLYDLQLMFYSTALMPQDKNYGGVRYNVIRRPLSGGKGSIRQKQNESLNDFYLRLAGILSEEPGYWFMRWNAEVTRDEVYRFQKMTLFPLLSRMCQWYDWVTTHAEGQIWESPIHYRHPYGATNRIDEYGPSDIDDYLNTGSTVGLTKTRLFKELEDA